MPRETVLTYDDDRNLDTIEQPDGTLLNFDYDTTKGRLTTAAIPGAGVYSYVYDQDDDGAGTTDVDTGQLKSITSTGGFGTATIAYGSSRGMLPASISFGGNLLTPGWSGTPSGSVAYTWTNAFLVDTIQPLGAPDQPAGYAARYIRDADDLLTKIEPVSSGTGATLTLAPSTIDGHLVSTTVGTSPNTVSTTYDVDVSTSTPGTGDFEGMTASVGSTLRFSTSYERDGLGRITRLDETVLGVSTTRKYVYDGAGRLTDVLDGSDLVVSEYEYDGNGARTRALTPSGDVELGVDLGCGSIIPTAVDAQDRLCRYGDYEYVYDDNGRLFTKTQISTSGETAYTYDGLGRLHGVTLPDSTEIEYVHDALGRRVGKVVDGSFQKGWRYGLDSLRPIAQLDSQGRIEKTFVYGTRVNVPDLIVDRVGGATYRVITDHLGSVRLVINVATGAVVQQMSYDEFGNVLVDTVPGFQPFGFAGGLYDADTGLVRFGARDYDAVTGRWTAKDPVLFRGGSANLYAYVNNDPVNWIDPTGLWTVGGFLSGGGGLGVGAGAGVSGVVDGNGGAAILGTVGAGAAYGGGWAGGIQVTNAKSWSNLTGYGGSIGLTLGPVSIEILYGDGYVGIGIGAGAGAEYHSHATYTKPLASVSLGSLLCE